MDKIDAMNLKSKKLLEKYSKNSSVGLTNKENNMEAPKEIYLRESMFGLAPEWAKEPLGISFTHSDIKYIRADLAELTWEDIKTIFQLADNYDSELNRPKYLTQEYCEEVLRRFNESKNKK